MSGLTYGAPFKALPMSDGDTLGGQTTIGAEASVGTKLISGGQISNLIVQSCCLGCLFRIAQFDILFCVRAGLGIDLAPRIRIP